MLFFIEIMGNNIQYRSTKRPFSNRQNRYTKKKFPLLCCFCWCIDHFKASNPTENLMLTLDFLTDWVCEIHRIIQKTVHSTANSLMPMNRLSAFLCCTITIYFVPLCMWFCVYKSLQ